MGDKRKMLSQIIDNQNKLLLEKEREIAELNDKLNNLASVAEVRLANWQKYEKENAEQEELLNSTLDENKEIYKKMAELDTALEDCTESLTDARIKIKELEKELKSEKEYNSTLRKEIDEYTNSHTLCVKYKELEKKISNLLSCKNCPDNKGGLLCQKEYEDKCLAQKIQYIKELKEENEEQKKKIENLQKYLDTRNCYRECAETWVKLTNAKEIIKLLLWDLRNRSYQPLKDIERAEQFLKE